MPKSLCRFDCSWRAKERQNERVILQIDVKWQCRFQQEHFRSPRLRQAAMRCHVILKLMCAFRHGRVGRCGEDKWKNLTSNSVHGYVCM